MPRVVLSFYIQKQSLDTNELCFFQKLHEEIAMVNKWYIEKMSECQTRVKEYETQVFSANRLHCQVSHFCTLREEKAISRSSPQFRQLEFGLKEVYRTLDYLHNYCTLNRTAIDKILKKHDKSSSCKSRDTINDAVSKLQFAQESDEYSLRQFTERLWKEVCMSLHCYLVFAGRKVTLIE